jgi:hypothetical protein
MKLRSLLLATTAALAPASFAAAADMPLKAPEPAPPPPFFLVNDTSISYTYYARATNAGLPGSSATVPGGIVGTGDTFARNLMSIDHFDVWQYGSNFIHAEFDQYGKGDPSQGIPGAQGSREFFAVARSTFGLNELSHSKVFSNPFIKDVSIEIGGNAGVQDEFLDEHTTVGMVGLQWQLNLPGVVNVALMAEKEYTRNSFDSCGNAGFGVAIVNPFTTPPGACNFGLGPFSGNREFQPTWRVETFVSEPLTFLGPSVPLTFQNILNLIGPKGTGISQANLAGACGITATCLADAETKVEVFEDARLTLDTSQVFWGKKGIWDTYIGYRYWYNKFGTDHNAPLFSEIAPGTSIESTVYAGMTYHFKNGPADMPASNMPLKAPAAPSTPFFLVNDTSISYTYYARATNAGLPGSSATVPGGVVGTSDTFARNLMSIDHFDVWQYGANFIHAEFDQYGNADPSYGIPGAQGSREFFAVARSTFGLNELSHSKVFSNPFIKDVSIEIGGNAGVQDEFLDEHTTVGMVGLQWQLNLPGVVNVALMAEKEYTRNSFDSCGNAGFGVAIVNPFTTPPGACNFGLGPFSGNREFQPTWRVETFVSEPLTFLGPSVPLTFQNILNLIGPKGTGISQANLAGACGITATCLADAETKVEVFEDARLTLDTSQVFWGKKGIWDTYVGYRYWYNKFGTDHNAPLFSQIAPGTSIESTAYAGMTYHFKS